MSAGAVAAALLWALLLGGLAWWRRGVVAAARARSWGALWGGGLALAMLAGFLALGMRIARLGTLPEDAWGRAIVDAWSPAVTTPGGPDLSVWVQIMTVLGHWQLHFLMALVMTLVVPSPVRPRLGRWFLALLGVSLSCLLAKVAFDRTRPPDALVVLGDNAYPSGHAGISLVFAGLVAAVCGEWRPGRFSHPRHGRVVRRACGIALASLVAAIAVSRLVLRVHWPSDVAGGLMLGTFWSALPWLDPAPPGGPGPSGHGRSPVDACPRRPP